MFEKLEKWLESYEKEMVADLLGLKEAVAYARPIIFQQTRNGSEKVFEAFPDKDKFRGYGWWDLPAKWEYREETSGFHKVVDGKYVFVECVNRYIDAIVTIDGVEFKDTPIYEMGHYSIEPKKRNALESYVASMGHNPNDIALIDGRDEEWIRKYCAKQKELKRKYIEDKVRKICGDELEEVAGREVSDLYVRGTNGKTAHIWAITAGGYNIQRLHTRILVKEVK